ncbi:DUF3662 domain-containing protein [Streptomyces sp. NPDC048172]|uniref:DUF3662 domain-containing protein n=1 Tax=Streptomyces sp. NPDC048172 TaxID=3365505 RepID=UPI003713117F
MRTITRVESTMERWAATVWSAVRRPRNRPIEVVSVLRRECDLNALILGRGRVLVPNHFTIELPYASHRRLAEHGPALGPELAAQVRGYAAEQRYSFTGPVSVQLSPLPGDSEARYRVSSRIAPGEPERTCGDEMTRLLPLPPEPF